MISNLSLHGSISRGRNSRSVNLPTIPLRSLPQPERNSPHRFCLLLNTH